MSQPSQSQPRAEGPGSRAIAAGLLETLTRRGRLLDRTRALRAAGPGAARIAESPVWLEPDCIARMLAAASIEEAVARSIGNRLVSPESMGVPLYTLGLATPEKAYRRLGLLLPREAPSARWETIAIEGGQAELVYRPHDANGSGDAAARGARATACALRRGMLEAIPTLYGLLPARVGDEACVARGDGDCRYRVVWRRGTTRGLRIGAGIGAAVAAAGLGLTSFAGAGPTAPALLGALAAVALGAAFGRISDLGAQLEAVGGARRGQLALFDQLDDQLATRLDALARADAKLDEGEPGPRTPRVPGSDAGAARAGSAEHEAEALAAAQEIHAAAGDLECFFERRARDSARRRRALLEVAPEWSRVREIRERSARLAKTLAGPSPARRPVDLVRLVGRAVASVRPALRPEASVVVEAQPDLEPVACEPIQIEQVVVQLLRNAVEASSETGEPEARVTLQRVRGGVEIAVEDRGAGIDSEAVDQLFDPFSAERPIGGDGGIGLPLCLRIAQAHGGELRIETDDRPGTRVSVVLPDAEGDGPGGQEDV